MKILLLSLICIGMEIMALDLSKSEILVPDRSNQIHALAGNELQKHLELITGCRIPVNPPEKNGGFQFIIGKPAPGNTVLPDKTEANYEIRGKQIWFWGDDYCTSNENPAELLEARTTRCGTLSAVYCFLENEFGIRWIRPGDEGIVFNRQHAAAWPEDKKFTWTMPLAFTGVRVYWWRWNRVEPLNSLTPEALRMTEKQVDEYNLQSRLWYRRMRHGRKEIIRAGHAFTDWWDKYGKTHPEYFGMNLNGQRGLPEKQKKVNKLCVSNLAVADQIIHDWVSAGMPEYLNICPNDGTPGFCRCPDCSALDEVCEGETFPAHLTDRYLFFWNRIAEKAVKLRPDVKLVTYIYSYYRMPPRREKVKYPDNMLFGMVLRIFEDNDRIMDDWAAAGVKNIFIRPNVLCWSIPFQRGLEKMIYDDFRQVRRFKIIGTDYDGTCGNRNIEFEYYIAARMMNNPEAKFEDMEEEYYSAYGEAAPEVKAFYHFWWEHGRMTQQKIKETLQQKQLKLNDVAQLSNVIQENIELYYKEDDFIKAENILKQASAKELDHNSRMRFENLMLVNRHSLVTWHFINEANKKGDNKANQLEGAAQKLVDFRNKHNAGIAWNWPDLFGHGRGEKKWWPTVDWFQKEVLKKEVTGADTVFNDSFTNGKLGKWKPRDLYKQMVSLPDGTSCVELTSADNPALGLSRMSVPVEAGKHYRFEAETRLKDNIDFLRFRITDRKTNQLDVKEKRNDDKWHKSIHEFMVPDGAQTISIYIGVSPGNGSSAYIRKLSLIKI